MPVSQRQLAASLARISPIGKQSPAFYVTQQHKPVSIPSRRPRPGPSARPGADTASSFVCRGRIR